MIVPFLFFYLSAFLLKYIVWKIAPGVFQLPVSWTELLVVFHDHALIKFNPPIWFLLALFNCNILFYLVNDNLIFNYATQYCQKHPTIASPENFEVTDADYAEFKEMVKKADFKYDQQSEKILKSLKEMAEFEGYMKDASDEFKALEQKLTHNLDRDLDYFSKDIKNMIAQDIIKRYYFQRGGIIQQLKDDNDLNEAVKVLGDSAKYREMLSAPVAKN